MNFDFKNNTDFRDSIRLKEVQILDRTNDKIQESDGFKIIFAGLKSMIQKNAFNGSRVISISETEILNVKLNGVNDFNDLFASDEFTYSQVLTINSSVSVTSHERTRLPEDSNDARNWLSNLSNSGRIVFLLLKDKINYFINGIDKSESPFFSMVDVNKYNEKKNIGEINDVFAEYQEVLKERRNYCKFFIEKSHLKSIRSDLSLPLEENDFIITYKHILRNKPEDTFREDLRLFLDKNLRVSQIREYLLESIKRLDIYLYDEYGEIYLIEVKWVGESVHPDGKKFGTEYKASSINPDAYFQTLNYLDELDRKGQNIMRAYLVVFDARKENLEDTGYEFDVTKLNETQSKHYRKFQKVNDFRVCNIHPS